jgi:DNA-binding transcriptional ArsR family regulator
MGRPGLGAEQSNPCTKETERGYPRPHTAERPPAHDAARRLGADLDRRDRPCGGNSCTRLAHNFPVAQAGPPATPGGTKSPCGIRRRSAGSPSSSRARDPQAGRRWLESCPTGQEPVTAEAPRHRVPRAVHPPPRPFPGTDALGHATRLRLLLLLAARGELSAGGLGKTTRLPQSTTSKHLLWLRLTGVVAPRRAGRHIYYRLRSPFAAALLRRVRRG